MNVFLVQSNSPVSGRDGLGVYSSRKLATAEVDRLVAAQSDVEFKIVELTVDSSSLESPGKVVNASSAGAAAPAIGTVGWMDLTVDNCEDIRDFYEQVIGWHSSAVSLGEYDDYCVHPSADADPVAGICHAKGANAQLTAAWLIYLKVADLEQSLQRCEQLAGEVLVKRQPDDYGRIAVIRDPAGAACALFQPAN